jgi:predicted dehydrogenase
LKKKLRIAIAGAAIVTRHYLIAWSRLSEVAVVAIHNRNLEKALNLASEIVQTSCSTMVPSLCLVG